MKTAALLASWYKPGKKAEDAAQNMALAETFKENAAAFSHYCKNLKKITMVEQSISVKGGKPQCNKHLLFRAKEERRN